jgi:hypothetical protein
MNYLEQFDVPSGRGRCAPISTVSGAALGRVRPRPGGRQALQQLTAAQRRRWVDLQAVRKP